MRIVWWFLVLSPTLPFVALSLSYWRIVDQKIRDVERRLTQYDPDLYRRAYGSASVREIERELRAFHNWRTYLAPIVLTCLIASIATAIALSYLGVDLGLSVGLPPARTLPTVLVAVAGAYLWGLDDLIRRHRSADISSTALHSTWLRMLICAAIGGLLGRVINSSTSLDLVVALAIGGLPIEDIREWLTSRADLRMERAATRPADLQLVQGITRRVRDRLYDEDIDSVQALAFADPVRLLFRTNLEWNVILDLVDQAMLINVVGEKIDGLRVFGARGAIEMASLYQQAIASELATLTPPEALNDDDGPDYPSDSSNAVTLLARIGAELGQDATAARNIGYQMYYDPLVQFVWTHWNATGPDTHHTQEAAPDPSQLYHPARGSGPTAKPRVAEKG